MGEQHSPVGAEPLEETAPVEPVAVGKDDMGHVRAVEALALHDERLRPHALLRRRHQDVEAEHVLLGGVLEPLVVHHRHAVARAEDHVDEPIRRPDLGQPVREHQLGLVAGGGAYLEQPVHVAGPNEDVEVLGGAVDSRLVHEGERPPHQERHLATRERLHRLAIVGTRRGLDQRLRGRERHVLSSQRHALSS